MNQNGFGEPKWFPVGFFGSQKKKWVLVGFFGSQKEKWVLVGFFGSQKPKWVPVGFFGSQKPKWVPVGFLGPRNRNSFFGLKIVSCELIPVSASDSWTRNGFFGMDKNRYGSKKTKTVPSIFQMFIIILTFAANGLLELEANTVKKKRTVRLWRKIILIRESFQWFIMLLSDCW